MKSLTYVDSFFPEELYQKYVNSSLNCQYEDTNQSKRSFCTEDIKFIDLNLYKTFIDYVKKTFNLEIIDCQLKFYKRKNTIYNPHIDGFPLHILVYLQGEKYNIKNGTFFVGDNNTDPDLISVQTANFQNTAVIFDGNFRHGSLQGKYGVSEVGFRYSLNCFIKEYRYISNQK